MKQYDFDRIIDRHGTSCIKYDAAAARGYASDVLPLWVADMDFQCADEIISALSGCASHGIFGYSSPDDSYYEAVIAWMRKHHGWEVQKDWLVKTPGVVFAISQAIRAFTQKGDGVMINSPVYYPFAASIRNNGRVVADSPLIYKNGAYSLDYEDIERTLAAGNVKLYILCSPHNPVGRVWTEDELRRIGALCKKYHVLVLSDEIHQDFVYEGWHHTVFTRACPDMQDSAIICTAPSKTFNIAGIQNSNIFISSKELRAKFKAAIASTGYDEMNIFSLTAAKAAYLYGEEWLTQLKAYLAGNLTFLRTYLAQKLPAARLVEPQGTYLVWIDFSGYGLSDRELNDRIAHKAKVWLDAGSMFGKTGEQFQRLNIACPRSIIKQALDAISAVL